MIKLELQLSSVDRETYDDLEEAVAGVILRAKRREEGLEIIHGMTFSPNSPGVVRPGSLFAPKERPWWKLW